MRTRRGRAARWWFCATVAVAAFALVVQLVLVISGASVLTTEDPPGLGARLARLVGYFTIQSNVLALVVAILLARRPDRDGGTGWRVARLDAVLGMTVTGLVHWFLLRPLLHLQGWAYLTDKLLHVAGPLLVVLGWLVFGPRPRVTARIAALALIWPVLWVAVILLQAQASGWYPYPFLDVGRLGLGPVLLTCLGVTVLFLILDAVFWLLDRRLPAVPHRSSPRDPTRDSRDRSVTGSHR